MLGDQPLITAAYLNKLIDKAKEQPETCVASGYKNKKGVPAIFPESYFDALEELSGDQGAKALLNSDPSVIALNAEDLLQDIDISTINKPINKNKTHFMLTALKYERLDFISKILKLKRNLVYPEEFLYS